MKLLVFVLFLLYLTAAIGFRLLAAPLDSLEVPREANFRANMAIIIYLKLKEIRFFNKNCLMEKNCSQSCSLIENIRTERIF